MLEARSPASSLIDAAVFGLLPGDPSAPPAIPRTDAPRLDAAVAPLMVAGERRPVVLDDAKMADTQAAPEPARWADANTRPVPELDEPVVGFTPGPVWRPMPDALTSVAVADEPPRLPSGPVIRTEAEPWGGPAGAVKSDPEMVPLAYSGYSSGGSPIGSGYVGTMKVQEVDFQNDILVSADPGNTPYPTEAGRPEWRDEDLDGVIKDADSGYPDYTPVEWSVPTA